MADLQSTLLTALSSYGAIVIFGAILLASIGLPLPASFLLIMAGSFVESGDLDFNVVVLAGLGGAVLGDHFGYAIGRYGGRGLTQRITRRMGAEKAFARAEAGSLKWGASSVFLSRWLITAIGPYVNLISGITRLKPAKFSVLVLFGETLWVLIYVQLGRWFSDSIGELTDILGDLSYVILGLAVIGVLTYLLLGRRNAPATT